MDEAQENKPNLVCRKLGSRPSMRILDIGLGRGGTARFVAGQFKVEVVGITVCEKQVQFGKELRRALPVKKSGCVNRKTKIALKVLRMLNVFVSGERKPLDIGNGPKPKRIHPIDQHYLNL